jgi:adenylate kinase
MDRGDLVPDEVTDAMVKDRLERDDAQGGFLLDGYPRNLNQAQTLAELEAAQGRKVTAALYIKVSDDEIVKRLGGRLICRNCQTPFHQEFNAPAKEGICDQCGGELYQRDDDNPDTVRTRLKTFHAKTAPVAEFYREAGVLTEIEGEGEVEAVTLRCLAFVRKLAAAAGAPEG